MLQSTPVQQSQTVSSFQRADGSSARVMAVAPRQATPQDSGVPVIAGVAAYQITNTYMGDCGSSCSSDSKTAEVLAVAETGDSCCPLTGSKGAEILAVADTEGCETECTDEQKAACSADKMACGTEGDSNTVEILMVAGEEACSTDKAACDSAKTECKTKAACETEQLAAAASPADNG